VAAPPPSPPVRAPPRGQGQPKDATWSGRCRRNPNGDIYECITAGPFRRNPNRDIYECVMVGPFCQNPNRDIYECITVRPFCRNPNGDIYECIMVGPFCRNPNGDSIIQPRVARHALPWVIVPKQFPTPTGLHHPRPPPPRAPFNPFRVDDISAPSPGVGASRQRRAG